MSTAVCHAAIAMTEIFIKLKDRLGLFTLPCTEYKPGFEMVIQNALKITEIKTNPEIIETLESGRRMKVWTDLVEDCRSPGEKDLPIYTPYTPPPAYTDAPAYTETEGIHTPTATVASTGTHPVALQNPFDDGTPVATKSFHDICGTQGNPRETLAESADAKDVCADIY